MVATYLAIFINTSCDSRDLQEAPLSEQMKQISYTIDSHWNGHLKILVSIDEQYISGSFNGEEISRHPVNNLQELKRIVDNIDSNNFPDSTYRGTGGSCHKVEIQGKRGPIVVSTVWFGSAADEDHKRLWLFMLESYQEKVYELTLMEEILLKFDGI